jgi:hypothetical protein
MGDVCSRVERALAAPRDYWGETGRGLARVESRDAMLPEFRALPDYAEATALVAEGAAASRALMTVVRREREDTPAFRNALFLLMYFDSLFVYRDLKAQYSEASPEQRPWLDAACRKIVLRCLEVPETAPGPQTREIVRNTWRGRLVTTSLIVDLAAQAFGRSPGTVIVRDMAVSDGVTVLDLAEEAVCRGVDVSITATDLRLYLRYAEHEGDEVACYRDGEPLQYAIGGCTYRASDVPAALASAQAELEKAARGPATQTITLLAPQVDHAVETGRHALRFREEDAFHPDPDIRQADIIRIANLLVERTDEHRGYYYRQDIRKAISQLGQVAKDGAYLFLDNFMRKVEHVGLWRKDASAREWTRLPVGAEVAVDLEGVTSIPIEPEGARPRR